MGSSDIVADLTAQFEERAKAGDYDEALDSFMTDEVVPVWVGNSPEDTGDYRDSIRVTKPAKGGKGQVGALSEVANIIEWGSEDTPEWAPRLKTVEHFNGAQ